MLHHLNIQPTKPSRTILLGGSGFIGKSIINILKDQKVSYLSLSSKEVDLTCESSVEKLCNLFQEGDSVIFLSALTPDKGRGMEAFEKNMKMAIHVAKALERKPVSHLVYFSSDAVYSMKEPVVTEETLTNPEDLYGLMHATREKMMAMTFKNTAVIRPTLVYGIGDTHNSYGPNRFRRMAEEKKEITLFGGGEEKRDHIFVDDLGQLIVNVLMHKSVGQLNAVTGYSVSYVDLAHKVSALYGEGGVKVILTERKNPITNRHFDHSSVLKAFPSFRFTSLEEGLMLVYEKQHEKVDA